MKPDNVGCSAGANAGGRQVLVGSGARPEKALTMSLEALRLNGAVVVHCQGRVIFRGEARSLSSMIAEVLPTARRMVVDLAGVASVHSEALGELVLTHMWAEAAGYTLKFACPPEAVQRVLENTNLISVLEIHQSVAEAMAAMEQEEVHSA